MKIEKPITPQLKEKANKVWRTYYNGKPFTKTDVMELCGVKSERQAREIIALLATKKPIISLSSKEGYRIAVTKHDLEEVRNTRCELTSRIRELQRRVAPLISFEEKNGGQVW